MGSSSAFTVGLINLCHAYKGKYVPNWRLAEMACEVEIDKLKEPIGKQDQYGCALGGVNLIKFNPDGSVDHEKIPLGSAQVESLENNLAMFYLGGTRSASALLKRQSERSASNQQVIENLKAMRDMASNLRGDLFSNIDSLGEYLHEGWLRKQALSPDISNPLIEEVYQKALDAGATGGKLLGAGGSGFLLTYSPRGSRQNVVDALQKYSFHAVNVDSAGAAIIYSD